MKASELRIGNWIAHEPTIDDWEEIIVRPGTIIQCEISPDSFMPIPLTEEWLLNLGLTDLKRKNEKHFKFNDFVYVLDYGCVTYNGVIISRQDIKYVHQLQNLYFALTGEELILNEQ
jgi:hypothetical protein